MEPLRKILGTTTAAALLCVAATASAGTVTKTQSATITTAGGTATLTFDRLPPAVGQLNVKVALEGDYGAGADRPKFATVDIDGAQSHEMCRTGCRAKCGGAAQTASYQAPGKLVGDGNLQVRVTNSKGVRRCDRNRVTVTLNYPGNTAPVARDGSVELREDETAQVELTAEDKDGDGLSYEIAEPPAHGDLTGTPPKLSYQPEADFNGEDSFRFVASDGRVTSDPASIRLNVLPVNDPPQWQRPEQTMWTLNPGERVDFEILAEDVDDDPISYDVEGRPEGATVTENEGAAGPRFRWTPTPEQLGAVEVILRATDGEATAERTVVLEVVAAPAPDTGMGGDAGDTGAADDVGPRADADGTDALADIGTGAEASPTYGFQGGAGCSAGAHGRGPAGGWWLALVGMVGVASLLGRAAVRKRGGEDLVG